MRKEALASYLARASLRVIIKLALLQTSHSAINPNDLAGDPTGLVGK